GSSLPGEFEMICSTSEVAVCCSSASARCSRASASSRLYFSSSFSNSELESRTGSTQVLAFVVFERRPVMRLRLFARLRATITSSAQSLVRLPVRPGRIEPKPINPNRTARRTRGVSLDHLVGVARALAIRGTDFMEYRRRAEHYSALMLADLITLPH